MLSIIVHDDMCNATFNSAGADVARELAKGIFEAIDHIRVSSGSSIDLFSIWVSVCNDVEDLIAQYETNKRMIYAEWKKTKNMRL